MIGPRTNADLRQQCRTMGLTMRYREGEYRVNFYGGSEATAYYTNDRQDAWDTARAMYKWQQEQDAIANLKGQILIALRSQ